MTNSEEDEIVYQMTFSKADMELTSENEYGMVKGGKLVLEGKTMKLKRSAQVVGVMYPGRQAGNIWFDESEEHGGTVEVSSHAFKVGGTEKDGGYLL
jgi:hypothetical protein